MMEVIEPLLPSSGEPGQIAAFERFFRSELPAIYRYCASRVGPDDAEDVAAEVFHAAALAHARSGADTVTRAWLFAVARNKVIDRWRKATRAKARLELAAGRPEDFIDFPDNWTDDVRRDAVLRALGSISPRHRALLVLHHVDGMTIRELADAADQTTAAIESALARARQAFRRVYNAEEDA